MRPYHDNHDQLSQHPQRYAVFHARDALAMLHPQAQARRWYSERSRAYTHVADVIAPLERVFRLTNHIDQAWTSNSQVVWSAAGRPLRSTSVGDILLPHLDGQTWLVMPSGLRALAVLAAEDDGTPAALAPHYPLGLARVADYTEVFRRYREEVPLLAEQVALPLALPCRHPALAQLQGRYPVEDQLPPWWQECVDALARGCPCLEPLLRTLSREEFRRGSIDQSRWRAWQDASCHLSGEAHRPTHCWKRAGPSLSRLMAALLPTGERPRWLDRFVCRGEKKLPPELDLVISAHPAWWLNMANGRNWYSCMGTGPDRDVRLVGNWYDPGVALAALVARGEDCWTPGALIARATLRVVTGAGFAGDAVAESGYEREQEVQQTPAVFPMQRVVMGRIYHNDVSAACTLLTALSILFEQRRLPWGCIAGTTTADYALDGSLGALDITREPHEGSGVPYWLPAGVERPALEGQVTYLKRSALENDESSGNWTYPSMRVHACRRRMPTTTTTTTRVGNH